MNLNALLINFIFIYKYYFIYRSKVYRPLQFIDFATVQYIHWRVPTLHCSMQTLRLILS